MRSLGDDPVAPASGQRAAWSAGLVVEAAHHPINLRLYADAPYLRELYCPDVLQRVVHPARASADSFSHPLHLASSRRRWYLPGRADELLLHTSCVAACYPAIIGCLSPLTDASDVGPPHVRDLLAGSSGAHKAMLSYWAQLDSETRRRFNTGFTHVAIADVYRCIESMDPGRMFSLLEDAGAPIDALRILKAMQFAWQHAGCRGLPLIAGFRVLLKLYMKDVDDRLRADGIAFLRLQDDFRLFAGGEHDARHALDVLSDALAACGLSLNLEKTMVLSRSQLRYSWRKHYLDWKRSFNRGIGFPLLSDSLRIVPLRAPAIHLLHRFYSHRWTAA